MNKEAAIAHFGGALKLSKALGLSPAAISQWGETVPVRRAYELERVTNGALKVNHSNEPELKKAS